MTFNAFPVGRGVISQPSTTLLNYDIITTPSEIINSLGGTFGAQLTSTAISTSLTKVLSVTGKGVIPFLMIASSSGGTTVSPAGFRIKIDGRVVVEDDSISISNTQAIVIIGSFNAATNEKFGTHDSNYFNKNFSIELSGDGVDSLQAAYKFYKTK